MCIINWNITLKKPIIKSKIDIRLIIILIIYLILGIILFRYYQYQINNDGIGYITTAHSYMSGNVYGSISDYWGPLLSWLLIPFLLFGHTPLAALQLTKLLSIIIGFFTIIGIRQLSYRLEMNEVIRSVVLLMFVPLILYFALSIITPDLLMVCVFIYYLEIIFNLEYPNKLSNGALCGIFGALAYLSKSYGFTFFIATFLIFNLFQYFRNSDRYRREKVIKNLVLGFVIFLMISGLWIGLISIKDQKLTFGTAGEYNYALVGPQSQGVPDYIEGIHNPNQINSNLIPKQWSPFKSWNNFNYQINLIWNNTLKIGTILTNFSILSLLIILAYIIMCIQPPRKMLSQNVLYYLVTILILAGSFVVVVVEERYIWLIYVLLILIGGYLINLLFKIDFFTKEKFSNVRKTLVLVVFAFLFITMPINYLVQNVNTGEDSYYQSNILNQYGVHGNVASNDNLPNMNYLAYYMNITSFGQPQNNISASKLRSDLKKYKIDYYFIWDNSNQSTYMGNYSEITNGKIKNLKVYSLN